MKTAVFTFQKFFSFDSGKYKLIYRNLNTLKKFSIKIHSYNALYSKNFYVLLHSGYSYDFHKHVPSSNNMGRRYTALVRMQYFIGAIDRYSAIGLSFVR